MTDQSRYELSVPKDGATRAEFLRRAGALGAALTIPGLLAACSSGTSAGSTAASSASGPANLNPGIIYTPAAKGSVDAVTWNLPSGEPTPLDWIKCYDLSPNTVLANMGESLLRQRPDFSLEPGLAASYSQPSPTQLVYKLRPGVRFWNGSPVTVDDVVFSLNRHLDPAEGSYWAVYFTNVANIIKTAEDEVTINLKHPDVIVNQVMATPAGVVGQEAFVRRAGDNYGTASVGVMHTGPFRFQHWTPGTSIVLDKNPDYWDPTLQPKTRTITFQFLTDESEITDALLSGEIDGTYEAPLSGFTRLQAASNGKLYLGKSVEVWNLTPSRSGGPLGSADIRRVLLLAIDREAILRQVFSSAGQVARALAVPFDWGYATSVYTKAWSKLPNGAADPDAARALLKRAGVPKQPIVLAVDNDVASEVLMGEAIQSAAESVGLPLKLHAMPDATYEQLLFDPGLRKQVDAFLTHWYNDVADPLEMYVQMATPDAEYNYSGYSNPGVTSALASADGTTNPADRARLVAKAQALFEADVAWLSLINEQERLFMTNNITGAPATMPCYLYYPWAATVGASA